MGKIIFSTFKRFSFLFLFIALIVIGLITRMSFTDVFKDSNTRGELVVGVLPDELATELTERLEDSLPYSNYILKVKVISEPIVHNYVYGYNVQVEKVFKGDGLSVGDKFVLTKGGWTTFLKTGTTYEDDYQCVNLGFSNFLKINNEYLVFIENKVDTLDGEKVYSLYDYVIAPVFNYSEGSSTPHSPVFDDFSSVFYYDVIEDEFLCVSQHGIDEMLKLKRAMINKYN